jgi:multidrug resistance efflux pump
MHRVLIVLLPLLAGCSKPVAEAAPLAGSPWLATAVGRIDSMSEARHLVASTDGVIDAVLVERGQAVRRGQVLLQVSCRPKQLEADARLADAAALDASAVTLRAGARAEDLAAAEAVVSEAQASLLDSQQRLDLARALIEDGFISAREVDARTNARDVAAARLAAARSRFNLLQSGARKSELAERSAASRSAHDTAKAARSSAALCAVRSPIDGQVLQVLRREGEHSGANQGVPLIVVGDMSRLIVRAEISERDVAAVSTGQAVDVWIEGTGTRWQGAITHLASIMGRRTARSLDPTDRFDRDTREAIIAFQGTAPPALVGLRVSVGIRR